MGIPAIIASGLLSGSSDNNEGGDIISMSTDLQFKAFIKMALALAETTRDVKEFQKTWGGWMSWNGATGNFATYIWMIPKIADATGDMEKVKQILEDILAMTHNPS